MYVELLIQGSKNDRFYSDDLEYTSVIKIFIGISQNIYNELNVGCYFFTIFFILIWLNACVC